MSAPTLIEQLRALAPSDRATVLAVLTADLREHVRLSPPSLVTAHELDLAARALRSAGRSLAAREGHTSEGTEQLLSRESA